MLMPSAVSKNYLLARRVASRWRCAPPSQKEPGDGALVKTASLDESVAPSGLKGAPCRLRQKSGGEALEVPGRRKAAGGLAAVLGTTPGLRSLGNERTRAAKLCEQNEE